MGTRHAERRWVRRARVGATLVVALTTSLPLVACGGGAAPTGRKRASAPAPVVVATLATRDLVYVVEGTGSLEAYQVVTVPARVRVSGRRFVARL